MRSTDMDTVKLKCSTESRVLLEMSHHDLVRVSNAVYDSITLSREEGHIATAEGDKILWRLLHNIHKEATKSEKQLIDLGSVA